jgi:hypothetical protein
MTIVLLNLVCSGHPVHALPTQERINNDITSGKPVIVQVSVALADNENQWIVPVPAAIGDGQDASTNLYWGARYGLKTYMTRDAGWKKIASLKPQDHRILERLVLQKKFLRYGQSVPVYLVADAWDGKYINDTIEQFMRFNAGGDEHIVQVDDNKLYAGSKAHLIVYVGHNALMDYVGVKNIMVARPTISENNPTNDAIVLACKSLDYFSARLDKVNANPLVLTTGLMAPEAYTLDAAIEKWITGASVEEVRKAAAAGYNKYQKTGRKAAERLFGVQQ